MEPTVQQMLDSYDPTRPLAEAFTIPASWYTDPRIADLERRAVFGRTWQVVGHLDRLAEPGRFLTAEIAGEPLVLVRGSDNVLRGFYNVCRHHATAVVWGDEGKVQSMRCPYHGWTYNLEGELRGMTDFDGVRNFDKGRNGLVPVRIDTWEGLVFANLWADAPPLREALGGVVERARPLGLSSLRFVERRSYPMACNWKVFVDNYLDGGYHVPHMHKGLNSVLDYADYTIEPGDRYCVQSSPLVPAKADAAVAAVRKGDRSHYVWIHPNFMFNYYEGLMDTNLVLPVGLDRCVVHFDFYFADVSEASRAKNQASIEVAHKVQLEDIAICESVQRGLASRAYEAGRLSVRREGGEHLFHRLLHADLQAGLGAS